MEQNVPTLLWDKIALHKYAARGKLNKPIFHICEL